jgi:hypothetical protein
VLGDGAKYIVNSESFFAATFIIDRFHVSQALIRAFKRRDIYSRYFYVKLKFLLNNHEFDKFFNFLNTYKNQQKDSCLIKRLETLKTYIKNYQKYITRQNQPEFIGCRIEGYISHYIKVMFRSKPKIFNEKTISKIFLIKQFIFNGIDVFAEAKSEHQFNIKENQLK